MAHCQLFKICKNCNYVFKFIKLMWHLLLIFKYQTDIIHKSIFNELLTFECDRSLCLWCLWCIFSSPLPGDGWRLSLRRWWLVEPGDLRWLRLYRRSALVPWSCNRERLQRSLLKWDILSILIHWSKAIVSII